MNNNKKEEAEDDNFIIQVILNFSCKEAPKVTLTLNNSKRDYYTGSSYSITKS